MFDSTITQASFAAKPYWVVIDPGDLKTRFSAPSCHLEPRDYATYQQYPDLEAVAKQVDGGKLTVPAAGLPLMSVRPAPFPNSPEAARLRTSAQGLDMLGKAGLFGMIFGTAAAILTPDHLLGKIVAGVLTFVACGAVTVTCASKSVQQEAAANDLTKQVMLNGGYLKKDNGAFVFQGMQSTPQPIAVGHQNEA